MNQFCEYHVWARINSAKLTIILCAFQAMNFQRIPYIKDYMPKILYSKISASVRQKVLMVQCQADLDSQVYKNFLASVRLHNVMSYDDESMLDQGDLVYALMASLDGYVVVLDFRKLKAEQELGRKRLQNELLALDERMNRRGLSSKQVDKYYAEMKVLKKAMKKHLPAGRKRQYVQLPMDIEDILTSETVVKIGSAIRGDLSKAKAVFGIDILNTRCTQALLCEYPDLCVGLSSTGLGKFSKWKYGLDYKLETSYGKKGNYRLYKWPKNLDEERKAYLVNDALMPFMSKYIYIYVTLKTRVQC